MCPSSDSTAIPNFDAISKRIAQGEKIRFAYPSWGTFEIDGSRPYLCVHRHSTKAKAVGKKDAERTTGKTARAQDAETPTLLAAMASTLLLEDVNEDFEELCRAVERILDALVDVHGAALLIEIWAHPVVGARREDARLAPPSIQLHAPDSHAPMRFLEAFESASLSTGWPGGVPRIEVDYARDVQPQGLPPLPLQSFGRGAHLSAIGIELSANYRSAHGGLVYPHVLREMRRALTHVLTRSIFSFASPLSRQKSLQHPHQLVSGTVTDRVFDIDGSLSRLSDAYDLLLLVTPVNVAEQWDRFRASGFDCTPEFHYRPLPVDPSALKRELFSIAIEDIEDPALHTILADKRTEVERQLSLLGERGTPAFSLGTLQIFGRTESALVDLAAEILEATQGREDRADAADVLSAEDIAEFARAELSHYREIDSDFDLGVAVRDDVTGLLVSRGTTLIGRDARVARTRLDAALQHEVGTHVLTYHNGRCQPMQLLRTGMAGYEETQEGLAVLAEFLVGQLSGSRLRQIASRVLAVHAMEQGAEFIETFRLLHQTWGIPSAAAYHTTMRAFRGGGYAKDSIYLRGFDRVCRFLTAGGNLETLFLGKIALGQLETVEELRWREVLTAPRLMPRFLHQADADQRLEAVRGGASITELWKTGAE